MDDNDTNRKIVCAHLAHWGCRYADARNGCEALAALRQAEHEADPFDLVLVDMRMPEMDGEQLGQRIKNDPALKDVPLIMLTSIGQRGDASRLTAIGFAGYLLKPIKPSLLFDCLLTVLSQQTDEAPEPEPPRLVTRHSLAEDATQARANRGGRRILLVEDNAVNQQVALKILEKLGYTADAVGDGQDAVTALKTIPYDLVLMDCQMPRMDGYEATAAIRKMEGNTKHTPIVAMTAHAMAGDRERCLQGGMDDYLAKPVNPKSMADVLLRWLDDPGDHGDNAEGKDP